MRYKTVYSLILILWVFLTSFTRNVFLIAIASSIFAGPAIFCQIVIFFIYNSSQRPFSFDDKDQKDQMAIYGFFEEKPYGYLQRLEYLIMIIYFSFHVVFIKLCLLKYSERIKQNLFDPTEILLGRSSSQKLKSNQRFYHYIFIVFVRYSDILTLFILFWISMYTVNVIHLILGLFFVIFSIQTGTSIISGARGTKRDSSSFPDKKRFYYFNQKYWVTNNLY
jgi:hypothetical protein